MDRLLKIKKAIVGILLAIVATIGIVPNGFGALPQQQREADLIGLINHIGNDCSKHAAFQAIFAVLAKDNTAKQALKDSPYLTDRLMYEFLTADNPIKRNSVSRKLKLKADYDSGCIADLTQKTTQVRQASGRVQDFTTNKRLNAYITYQNFNAPHNPPDRQAILAPFINSPQTQGSFGITIKGSDEPVYGGHVIALIYYANNWYRADDELGEGGLQPAIVKVKNVKIENDIITFTKPSPYDPGQEMDESFSPLILVTKNQSRPPVETQVPREEVKPYEFLIQEFFTIEHNQRQYTITSKTDPNDAVVEIEQSVEKPLPPGAQEIPLGTILYHGAMDSSDSYEYYVLYKNDQKEPLTFDQLKLLRDSRIRERTDLRIAGIKLTIYQYDKDTKKFTLQVDPFVLANKDPEFFRSLGFLLSLCQVYRDRNPRITAPTLAAEVKSAAATGPGRAQPRRTSSPAAQRPPRRRAPSPAPARAPARAATTSTEETNIFLTISKHTNDYIRKSKKQAATGQITTMNYGQQNPIAQDTQELPLNTVIYYGKQEAQIFVLYKDTAKEPLTFGDLAKIAGDDPSAISDIQLTIFQYDFGHNKTFSIPKNINALAGIQTPSTGIKKLVVLCRNYQNLKEQAASSTQPTRQPQPLTAPAAGRDAPTPIATHSLQMMKDLALLNLKFPPPSLDQLEAELNELKEAVATISDHNDQIDVLQNIRSKDVYKRFAQYRFSVADRSFTNANLTTLINEAKAAKDIPFLNFLSIQLYSEYLNAMAPDNQSVDSPFLPERWKRLNPNVQEAIFNDLQALLITFDSSSVNWPTFNSHNPNPIEKTINLNPAFDRLTPNIKKEIAKILGYQYYNEMAD